MCQWRGIFLSFFANLYGVKDSDTYITKLLKDAGLSSYRYDKAGILSRGLLQRLAIARALVHQPILLLADEPFTGLDTDNDGANVSFNPKCQRRENAIITANNPDAAEGSIAGMGCKAQFDTGFSVIVTDIRERRFIADPVTGLAFAMGYFDHDGAVNDSLTQPYSFIIGEIFKIMDGKIRQR